jgi:hypothetical protein
MLEFKQMIWNYTIMKMKWIILMEIVNKLSRKYIIDFHNSPEVHEFPTKIENYSSGIEAPPRDPEEEFFRLVNISILILCSSFYQIRYFIMKKKNNIWT